MVMIMNASNTNRVVFEPVTIIDIVLIMQVQYSVLDIVSGFIIKHVEIRVKIAR
jgi:hypothetical protein